MACRAQPSHALHGEVASAHLVSPLTPEWSSAEAGGEAGSMECSLHRLRRCSCEMHTGRSGPQRSQRAAHGGGGGSAARGQGLPRLRARRAAGRRREAGARRCGAALLCRVLPLRLSSSAAVARGRLLGARRVSRWRRASHGGLASPRRLLLDAHLPPRPALRPPSLSAPSRARRPSSLLLCTSRLRYTSPSPPAPELRLRQLGVLLAPVALQQRRFSAHVAPAATPSQQPARPAHAALAAPQLAASALPARALLCARSARLRARP
jgi:hypothetical protein